MSSVASLLCSPEMMMKFSSPSLGCPCIKGKTNQLLLQGQAMDSILVVSEGDVTTTATTTLASNEFNVSFAAAEGIVRVHLDGIYLEGLDLVSTKGKETCRFQNSTGHHHNKPQSQALHRLYRKLKHNTEMLMGSSKKDISPGKRAFQHQQQQQQQQVHPPRECYPLCYHLVDATTNAVLGTAESTLFVFDQSDRIILCDIDGTITKSNVRGIWDTIVTDSYQHVHDGVCPFLQQLVQNKPQPMTVYQRQQQQQRQQHQGNKDPVLVNNSTMRNKIVYLTARPLSLASTTRKFLQNLRQSSPSSLHHEQTGRDDRLPPGPLLCNLKELSSILASELVLRDVHHHKMDLLERQILIPFRNVMTSASTLKEEDKSTETCPLVMGIGNSLTDTMAYTMAGIPLPSVYQINTKGTIVCFDKQEAEVMIARDIKTRARINYGLFRGSSFQDYTDPRLIKHCQSKLEN